MSIQTIQLNLTINDENIKIPLFKNCLDLDSCIAAILESASDQNPPLNLHIKPLDYANVQVSDENVEMLVSMGYSIISAMDALKFNDNSIEAAAKMLMNEGDNQYFQASLKNSYTEKTM